MPHDAPSLAEIQSRFQAALLDGSDDVLRLIPPNSRTTNQVLLGVYRHAYVTRLVEVVRNAYPLLARYMGSEPFDALARRYVTLYPSRHANARWYASDIPELLATDVWAKEPVLRDLATLERQLDHAFDAADAPVLDLGKLSEHPPESWGGLSFVRHPSAALLTLTTNAFHIWVALKNEHEAPDVALLAEPDTYLVWRRDGVPTVRRLEAEERMLWIEAAHGRSFGELAEMAATFDCADTAAVRMAQYLNGWLVAGLLSKAVT